MMPPPSYLYQHRKQYNRFSTTTIKKVVLSRVQQKEDTRAYTKIKRTTPQAQGSNSGF